MLYRGRPKGAVTIDYDVGRIQRHIKPLIGSMLVGAATQDDIIHLYNDIRLGKTATTEKTKPRGVARVKGGETAATRTLGLLGSIFSYAVKRRLRIDNPCRGVERASDGRRDRILTPIEYRALADAFTQLESNGANPTAIAAYRALMCSGYRKSEIFGLKPTAVDYHRHCIRLDSSKSGQQVRAMGITALRVIESAAKARKSQYVFPAKVGEGHVTDVRLFSKAVKVAGLDGITLHALRHSFASVALELEYSELTIAAMLGHRVSSVTSRYAHTVDRVVIAAADRVSQEIASRMLGDGGETAKVIDLAPGPENCFEIGSTQIFHWPRGPRGTPSPMSESHTTARQKWELPDWRDVTAYPRTQDLSVNEWRWEFLRRRQDYRDDFFRPSDKPYIAPDFPGELESPDRCFERQYHLTNAMDPRISVAEHKASSNKADKGVLFTFDFEMLFVDVRASKPVLVAMAAK